MQAAFEWRVYDVCAAMRQQSERRRQSGLARPHKPSHHFLDAAQARFTLLQRMDLQEEVTTDCIAHHSRSLGPRAGYVGGGALCIVFGGHSGQLCCVRLAQCAACVSEPACAQSSANNLPVPGQHSTCAHGLQGKEQAAAFAAAPAKADKHAALRARLLLRREEERQRQNRHEADAAARGAAPASGQAGAGCDAVQADLDPWAELGEK